MRLLSQVTGLTVGNLEKAEDGSYLVDNIPLWKNATTGAISFDKKEETDTRATNENGELLYCPKFYYDMLKKARIEDYIQTTESKSLCPKSDIYNDDGELVSSGFHSNLDLGNITTYQKTREPNGIDASEIEPLEQKMRDLTREDIMRIVAGFTKESDTIYFLSIRKTDLTKLSPADTKKIIPGYKISLRPYNDR